MSPEKMTLAIAKLHGFTRIRFSDKPGFQYGWFGEWNGKGKPLEPYSGHLPRYLSDLNAIHHAIGLLDDAQYHRYILALCKKVIGNWSGREAIMQARRINEATAMQKSEAYLRALGKWTE